MWAAGGQQKERGSEAALTDVAQVHTECHVSCCHGIHCLVQLLKGIAIEAGGAMEAEAVLLVRVLHVADEAEAEERGCGGGGSGAHRRCLLLQRRRRWRPHGHMGAARWGPGGAAVATRPVSRRCRHGGHRTGSTTSQRAPEVTAAALWAVTECCRVL